MINGIKYFNYNIYEYNLDVFDTGRNTHNVHNDLRSNFPRKNNKMYC